MGQPQHERRAKKRGRSAEEIETAKAQQQAARAGPKKKRVRKMAWEKRGEEKHDVSELATMSSSLPAKRRRLNDSLSSLNKPFVSPLKISKSESTPLKGNGNGLPTGPASSKRLDQAVKVTASPETTATDSETIDATEIGWTPVRKPRIPIMTSKSIGPDEAAARKALTAIELQIRSVRNDIDVLNQAAEITASKTDSHLEALTLKWKTAAQSAADEVFESVKDRVAQMGGVQAWRESERSKYDWGSGSDDPKAEVKDDDEGCEFDSQGEELPADEQASRKAQKRKARREMESAEGAMDHLVEQSEKLENDSLAEDTQDDIFTMEMMLRSLNIELDVIGYEKTTQAWIV